MPAIRYIGPYRAVVLDGIVCQHGEYVVFPAKLCEQVLAQDSWAKAPAKTTRKAG